jgi:hypothetical protein
MPARDCPWLNVQPAPMIAGGAPYAPLAVARGRIARPGRNAPRPIVKRGIEVGGDAP